MNCIGKKFELANNIIDYLKQHPLVKECALHGSLVKGNFDEYSDIDIRIDVSGFDNGKFMFMLPNIIKDKFPIVYTAFAPGLFPKVYVVSLALDKEDIFSFVDFECIANPHIQSISIDEIREKNDMNSLMLKLTIANIKHFLRGESCRDDIVKIAKFTLVDDIIDESNNRDLLVHTLEWFEQNCDNPIKEIAIKCKRYLY